MLKKILCLLFFTLILILNCNTPSSNSSGGESNNEPTILSTWEGTFDGDETGIISNWQLKSDNSITGTWLTNTNISISFSGTYILTGVNITLIGSGIAINIGNGTTDDFELTADGIIDITAGTGNGTCTITFLTWGIYNCNWDVNKI